MISGSTAAIVALSLVLSAIAGYFGVKFVFKKDTEIEDRRRAAFHLAATLKAYGMVRIPEFLGDYAVGDYSGMTKKLKDFASLVLSGEEAIMKELAQVHDRILEAKLLTAEGRAFLQAKVDEATAKATAVSVAAAASPLAALQLPVAKS